MIQGFAAPQQMPSQPSCLPLPPAPPAAKLGPAADSCLFSTMKCDGAEWGMRHSVRHTGQYRNQPHEKAVIDGYDTEASSTPEKQRPATQVAMKSERNSKRKREAEESSKDKHRDEGKKNSKKQFGSKKSSKKAKKCDDAEWGVRYHVRYIGQHCNQPVEKAVIDGYDTEASFTLEKQRPTTQEIMNSERNCKRKREAEESSKDKHKDEGKKNSKNQGASKKSSKKAKKRTMESKDGGPHHGKDRWSAEHYAAAERSLLDIMRSQGACFGTPVMYQVLREEACKHIDDTGLLEHLLKHMAGQVPEGSTHRFCRRRSADGAMEYYLELAELAEVRRQAGVSDPYRVPPPGWKPGDDMSLVKKQVEGIIEEINGLERQFEQLLCEDDRKFNAERAYSSLKKKCQSAMRAHEKIQKKMLCLKDMCENIVQMNGELKTTSLKEKYQSAVRAHEKLEKKMLNWKEFCKSVTDINGERNEDIYEASMGLIDEYDGQPIHNVVSWNLEGSKESVCRGYECAVGHFRLWNFKNGKLLNLEPWLGPNKAIYTTAIKGTFYCTITFEKHWVMLPIDGSQSWDYGFINRSGIWEFTHDQVGNSDLGGKHDQVGNSDLGGKHNQVKKSYMGGQSEWSNWSMLHECTANYSVNGLCPRGHGALKLGLESVRSACTALSDYKGETPVPDEVRESCAILISYVCEGLKSDFAFDVHKSSLLEFDPELGALSPAEVIKSTSSSFDVFKSLPQFNIPRSLPQLEHSKSPSIQFYVKVEDIKPDLSRFVRKWSSLGEAKVKYCIRKILDSDEEIPTGCQEDIMSSVAVIPFNKVPVPFSSKKRTWKESSSKKRTQKESSSNERTWKASEVDVGANPFNAPAHPLSIEFARPWPFNRQLATNRSKDRLIQVKDLEGHLKAPKTMGSGSAHGSGSAIKGILKALRFIRK